MWNNNYCLHANVVMLFTDNSPMTSYIVASCLDLCSSIFYSTSYTSETWHSSRWRKLSCARIKSSKMLADAAPCCSTWVGCLLLSEYGFQNLHHRIERKYVNNQLNDHCMSSSMSLSSSCRPPLCNSVMQNWIRATRFQCRCHGKPEPTPDYQIVVKHFENVWKHLCFTLPSMTRTFSALAHSADERLCFLTVLCRYKNQFTITTTILNSINYFTNKTDLCSI